MQNNIKINQVSINFWQNNNLVGKISEMIHGFDQYAECDGTGHWTECDGNGLSITLIGEKGQRQAGIACKYFSMIVYPLVDRLASDYVIRANCAKLSAELYSLFCVNNELSRFHGKLKSDGNWLTCHHKDLNIRYSGEISNSKIALKL